MPPALKSVIVELGLVEYLDAFVDHGFDTWDAVLDVQESDLKALGVKLGHRRKLQRHIASARGIPTRTPLSSVWKLDADGDKQHIRRQSAISSEVGFEIIKRVTKRKYRYHPKRDEHAPGKPFSAYVLFSNKMREDFKSHRLSFTELAKLVGEKWQRLGEAERENYQSQSNVAKYKYCERLTEYKKTPEYSRYAHYLQIFKTQSKLSRPVSLFCPEAFALHTSGAGKAISGRQKLEHNLDGEKLHYSNRQGGSGVAVANSTASGLTSDRGRCTDMLPESEPLSQSGKEVISMSLTALQLSLPSASAGGSSVDKISTSRRSARRGSSIPVDGGLSMLGANGASSNAAHRLPSYDYLSNFPVLRRMEMEHAGEHNAGVSTPGSWITSTAGDDAERFDGMSALLRAGTMLADTTATDE